MVGCMADCKIDMMVGCLGQVLSRNLGIEAAEVADIDVAGLREIPAAGSQVTGRAVAAVHMGLDSGCHVLWLWHRPMPKDCGQPFCE